MYYEYDEWREIMQDYYADSREMYEAEFGEEGDGTITYEEYNAYECDDWY